jgi:hypothetical protein
MPESVPAAGTLNGEVVVAVHEPVETKALKLQVGWFTHGRGNRSRRIVLERVLFAGELKAGEMRFPFAISLPTGPLTFHGENINVEWFAQTSVDLPWALDPRMECIFTLRRAQSVEPYVFGSRRPLTGLQSARPMAAGDGCMVGILVCFIILFFGVFALAASKTIMRSGWMTLIFAALFLIFCAIPFSVLYRVVGRKWANRRAGQVKFSVSNATPAAGDLLKLDLEFTPKRNLELNHIAVTLTCVERASSGSGTSRSTYSHTVHEEQTLLTDSRGWLSRREPVQFTQLIQIPPGAPPSFVTDDNEVHWGITIRMDIRNALDWEDSFTLAVRP